MGGNGQSFQSKVDMIRNEYIMMIERSLAIRDYFMSPCVGEFKWLIMESRWWWGGDLVNFLELCGRFAVFTRFLFVVLCV